MRAITYARFSSDLQSPMSIPDQQHEVAKLAVRLGATIKDEDQFTDAGISGGAFRTRPGIQKLLARLTRGDVDVVLAEALDRISRDMEDIAGIYKQVSFWDAKIHTISEGEVSELHIGLRGTMAAMFLKDLSQKTKRGLEGRVRAGFAAGGTCYGYRRVQVDGGAKFEIDPDTAEHVRWIFQKFADGMTARQIAAELNRRKVPLPRGKIPDEEKKIGWISSTIYTGILRHEIYVGVYRWGANDWRRDPRTYARIKRKERRPEAEQIVRHDDTLRIIPQPLWERVQERLAKNHARTAAQNHPDRARKTGWRSHTGRHPKHLLAGLLVCGECGSRMVAYNGEQLACYTNRYTGGFGCKNDRRVNRALVERTVLDAVASDMFDAAGFGKAEKAIKDEVLRRRHAAQKGETAARRQLAEVQTGIDNCIAAVRRGLVSDAVTAELSRLETDKRRLEAELKVEVVDFETLSKVIEDCVLRYRDVLARLAKDGLANRDLTLAREALADLVGTIEVQTWNDGSLALSMKGNYLGAIKLATRQKGRKNAAFPLPVGMGDAPASSPRWPPLHTRSITSIGSPPTASSPT